MSDCYQARILIQILSGDPRNIQPEQSGTYTVCYINDCGAATTCYFHLTVRTNDDFSVPITWTDYDPGISYDFRDEFPELSEPTMVLDDWMIVEGL